MRRGNLGELLDDQRARRVGDLNIGAARRNFYALLWAVPGVESVDRILGDGALGADRKVLDDQGASNSKGAARRVRIWVKPAGATNLEVELECCWVFSVGETEDDLRDCEVRERTLVKERRSGDRAGDSFDLDIIGRGQDPAVGNVFTDRAGNAITNEWCVGILNRVTAAARGDRERLGQPVAARQIEGEGAILIEW